METTMATRLETLRVKRADLETRIMQTADKEKTEGKLSAGEAERFERDARELDHVIGDLAQLEERQARADEIQRRMRDGTVRVYDGTADRDAIREIVNRDVSLALQTLERGTSYASAAALDVQDTLVREDWRWARWVAVHGSREYESAFQKLLACGDPGTASVQMTDAERAAMAESYAVRAQAEGANTSGGFAVPVFIDPTVILTNQESDDAIVRISRVVNITTNAWKGVSAAGVSWSFDPEEQEVSDDTITLAQPSVTVFMARGFIPYSIEVGEDWPGFQAEMARLLAAGYTELLVDKVTRGSGTAEPRGIITALDANTNVEVAVTTSGAFGDVDVYATWAKLPQKYRRTASWMMSASVMNKVRQMGTVSGMHAFSVNITQPAIETIMGRPVYDNAYFADSTSGAANICVVGAFDNFVIAQRTGLTVELIPHLVGTSGHRPTGQRGLFAYGRVGSNSANDLGFRLLQST
jgi:HK97 family phage major capsid protein